MDKSCEWKENESERFYYSLSLHFYYFFISTIFSPIQSSLSVFIQHGETISFFTISVITFVFMSFLKVGSNSKLVYNFLFLKIIFNLVISYFFKISFYLIIF